MTFLRFLFAGTLLVGASAGTLGAAAQTDTIRALAPTWPGFAPVFVAMEKGYFQELGLEVEFSFEDDRANVLAAMSRGDIEVDMRTVGEHQGRPRVADTPGIIIGTIDRSSGGDGVIADGSIAAVEDLKGKTVAVEPNIPARLLLQLALKEKNLSLADLKIVEIASADTVAVFADTSIAAIGSYEPFMSQALTNITDRKGKLLISSKDSDIIVDVITAREDDLVANPRKYANFLTGIYRAIAFYETNPEEFIALAAPHYNLSPAEVKTILDTSLSYTTLADAKALIGTKEAPGTLAAIFDTVMKLNVENGEADAPLAAGDEIDASAMALVGE